MKPIYAIIGILNTIIEIICISARDTREQECNNPNLQAFYQSTEFESKTVSTNHNCCEALIAAQNIKKNLKNNSQYDITSIFSSLLSGVASILGIVFPFFSCNDGSNQIVSRRKIESIISIVLCFCAYLFGKSLVPFYILSTIFLIRFLGIFLPGFKALFELTITFYSKFQSSYLIIKYGLPFSKDFYHSFDLRQFAKFYSQSEYVSLVRGIVTCYYKLFFDHYIFIISMAFLSYISYANASKSRPTSMYKLVLLISSILIYFFYSYFDEFLDINSATTFIRYIFTTIREYSSILLMFVPFGEYLGSLLKFILDISGVCLIFTSLYYINA